MKIIRLGMPRQEDRMNLINALANSGYHVWVRETLGEGSLIHTSAYHVCFEIGDSEWESVFKDK